MNTTQAGKIFCKKYNEVNNTHYTSKEIFCNVIAPLLFYGKKHLVNWTNSKFFNYLKLINKNKISFNETTFQECVESFCQEVENDSYNVMTTLNVFGGCGKPILNKDGLTTMFSFNDNIYFSFEERYNSFIGSIFASQCEGWNIIINNQDIIWNTFQNILKYREMLNNNHNLSDKQIYAWNTASMFVLSENNDISVVIDEFYKNDKLKIDKINIFNFIFQLQKHQFKFNQMELFSIGQMNTTCGAIIVDIPYVDRMFRFYKQIYQEMDEDFNYADFNKIIGGKARLLYKIIENGAVYQGLFNPWTIIETNKLTKYQEKIIQMFLNENEKQLANNVAQELFKIKAKSRTNIYEEEFFNYKKKENILKYISKIECESDIFDELIEMIVSENNDEKINMLMAYCEYLFKKIQKKSIK
jgi:hypothetical protein